MNDSMAQPRGRIAPLELSGWRAGANHAAAGLLFVLFIASGLWKITDAQGWAARLAQLKFPGAFSVPAALVLGIAETAAAVLVLVPRLRRWGAILIGILLVGFLGYFAMNYGALRGADCSCFPWVKRVVGPEFFAGDLLMLLLAVVAGVWAKPPESLRTAFVIAGAVVVFALVSYGVEAVRVKAAKAPLAVMVDGQPYSIGSGKVYLFFFNPQCMHCFDAAKDMSRMDWGGTRVIAVPVEQPQYAGAFLQDTGLRAVVTSDFVKLKTAFGYTAYPFAVAVENGREKASLTRFEAGEPAATLRKLGFIR